MAFITSLLNSMPGAISQGMIWGILAIGVYITFKILDISDLTVDGSLCTGAATCIVLIMLDVPTYIALIASFIVGLLAGFVTGLFHTAFGIPAILSGILTQLALYSVNLHIMGWDQATFSRANLPINADKYNLALSSRYLRTFSLQNPLLVLVICIVVLIAILYWFFGTEIGSSLRATGANENMARANGINTNRAKVLALMISNGLIALSGGLLAQYQGFADINMGRGAIVIGLAAVIIGEVLFSKIFKNFALKLLSCVFGAIIYYVVIQIVLKLGLSTDDLKLLSAIVVSLFLAVPYWKSNYASKHVKKEA
ncbi:MAG: ABC transporter permease [Erysipelotrichaceae bacterium]|uniref:ABC transporter permease n=1 Tax=Floccifex sp. TaxID=2815810 RepID=UPI002A75CCDB|nr:ABC transporter permease [Floccifex sp.]MDD7280811.1 ABC transporter permease [Erysipelotrichaceae bacterium]MDY2958272.1 ABC transporter permease [Floccifex sp.]